MLKKLKMDIIEFRKTVQKMNKDKLTVRDAHWTVYLINGVYVAIEYYKK